jgi:hypothetical protein
MNAGVEILTEPMKDTTFSDVTPYSPVDVHRFRLQDRRHDKRETTKKEQATFTRLHGVTPRKIALYVL